MRVKVLMPIAAVLLTTGVARVEATQAPAASSDACLTSDDERRLQQSIDAAAVDPASASAQHITATFYFQKSRDPQLTASQKRACVERTVAAEDRALAADASFLEALIYKNIALRELAAGEADAAVRQRLIAEADDLRERAVAARSAASTSPAAPQDSNLPLPPPPPPPPGQGAGEIQFVYAQTSFMASGNTQALEKVKDVRPVFPPIAITFGIQGTVVIEAAVDRQGRVINARVIESVPLLDQSALNAVRQWQFDPATVTPAGDRVVLTVRASFVPPR
jgi:TonB family protein